MEIVAHAYNGYTDKFGIPRQSGRVEAVETRIVFTASFRNPDAIRGIEQWSHLWLIWRAECRMRDAESDLPISYTSNSALRTTHPASLTVRPPRLGGNTRLGVFATRSPFRPNGLCLSSVRLLRVEETEKEGHVLVVAGADLMNGTAIYDIKPYLPYTDCHTDATNGFAEEKRNYKLQVVAPLTPPHRGEDTSSMDISQEVWEQIVAILEEDPRPAYHDDPKRVYGLTFGGYNLHFRVEEDTLTVLDIACIDR